MIQSPLNQEQIKRETSSNIHLHWTGSSTCRLCQPGIYSNSEGKDKYLNSLKVTFDWVAFGDGDLVINIPENS